MICVNELTALKCNKIEILKDLCLIIHPFAPHITEELWNKLGNKNSISSQQWPTFNEEYLTENELKKQVKGNFERFIQIGCYKGLRVTQHLPLRGQRTHTNAKSAKKLVRP